MQIHFPCSLLRVVAVASILVSSSMVNAQVVNIDFGRFGGNVHVGLAAAPDTAGANAIWNDSQGTVTNALDSIGNQTAVGIDVSFQGLFRDLRDQELSADIVFLQYDYLFYNSNRFEGDFRTGLISGLLPNNSYDLYIYGQGNRLAPDDVIGGQNVGIRIGTDVRHTSWDGFGFVRGPDLWGGDGRLEEDVEYVVFRAVPANSAGEISFDYFNPGLGVHGIDSSYFDSDTGSPDLDGSNSIYAPINGIQIVGDFPAVLIGDVNLDGVVGFLDISAFIEVLTTGEFQVEADCDENGEVNFRDISLFIALLTGS